MLKRIFLVYLLFELLLLLFETRERDNLDLDIMSFNQPVSTDINRQQGCNSRSNLKVTHIIKLTELATLG